LSFELKVHSLLAVLLHFIQNAEATAIAKRSYFSFQDQFLKRSILPLLNQGEEGYGSFLELFILSVFT